MCLCVCFILFFFSYFFQRVFTCVTTKEIENRQNNKKKLEKKSCKLLNRGEHVGNMLNFDLSFAFLHASQVHTREYCSFL